MGRKKPSFFVQYCCPLKILQIREKCTVSDFYMAQQNVWTCIWMNLTTSERLHKIGKLDKLFENCLLSVFLEEIEKEPHGSPFAFYSLDMSYC